MHRILQAIPGQPITVTLHITNARKLRSDCFNGALPLVNKIYMPNLSSAPGFPLPMVKIATGIYQFKFTLPPGSSGIGNYLVDLSYLEPDAGLISHELVEIVVAQSSGGIKATPA